MHILDARARRLTLFQAARSSAWPRIVRAAVPALLATALLLPESSWACRPRFQALEEYSYRETQSNAAFTGTVVDIQPTKSSPGATWLVTLKVERDFLDGQRGATVVVQSHLRDEPDPMLAGCIPHTYLNANLGERWLVLGNREAGLVIPDTRWSQPVPAAGLDAALRKCLHKLRTTGQEQH